MTENASTTAVGRRDLLKAAGAASIAATAAAAPGSAQEDGYGDWFSDVSNFDGTEDMTGQDQVTVEVGVEANDGYFGFGPAAVRVDPGTEVVWEWTGQGGQHNVVHDGGQFESDLVQEAGSTFSHTFDGEEGVYLYACTPHQSLGMKGAVVVGDVEVDDEAAGGGGGGDGGGGEGGDGEGGEGGGEESDYGGGGPGIDAGDFDSTLVGASMVAAFVSPLLFAIFLFTRRRGSESEAHYPK
ncbi:halocyanin domain-containing protein [Halostella sp. JP-L12]|uniref:halocyanin domain-containing protein n=1 Tax=Halostella TaxID=1843185 RepID=UPI000EF77CFD|nr:MULTISPECIES: halocyanin domain-containing protein [Halostella]NHN49851.1 halocyanin domain-containing protein [Halostella sp. JP-L12]